MYDKVNALLQFELLETFGDYFKMIKERLGSEVIYPFATELYPNVELVKNLDVFTADWYTPADSNALMGVIFDTKCKKCSKPDGSVYCPGQCVDKCAGEGVNCEIEIVPGPKPKVDGTVKDPNELEPKL